VADVAASDKVDDVFGDVGGVVADTFEILGDHDEFEGREDDRGVFHHVSEEFAEELIAKAVDLIVALEDGLGEFLVAADKGVEAVADHGLGEFTHARQINVRLHLWVAHDAHGGVSNVDGLIADAFEIAIDAGHGQKEAQVGSHGRLKGQGALDALVNFDLHFIDGVFLGENVLSKALVGVEKGVDGLMDGAFGKTPHPEEALLEFVEIVFEMAFHEFRFPSAVQHYSCPLQTAKRESRQPARLKTLTELRRATAAATKATAKQQLQKLPT